MTDTSQTPPPAPSKGGIARAGLGGLYMDICQHVTPPIVGYLCARYPIFGESLWYEIAVFFEATFAAFLIKLTPSHFALAIKEAIIYVKTTLKEWHEAWNQP